MRAEGMEIGAAGTTRVLRTLKVRSVRRPWPVAEAPAAVYRAPVAVQALEELVPYPVVEPPVQVLGAAVGVPVFVEPVLLPRSVVAVRSPVPVEWSTAVGRARSDRSPLPPKHLPLQPLR